MTHNKIQKGKIILWENSNQSFKKFFTQNLQNFGFCFSSNLYIKLSQI